jgi:hypothetical protein
MGLISFAISYHPDIDSTYRLWPGTVLPSIQLKLLKDIVVKSYRKVEMIIGNNVYVMRSRMKPLFSREAKRMREAFGLSHESVVDESTIVRTHVPQLYGDT